MLGELRDYGVKSLGLEEALAYVVFLEQRDVRSMLKTLALDGQRKHQFQFRQLAVDGRGLRAFSSTLGSVGSRRCGSDLHDSPPLKVSTKVSQVALQRLQATPLVRLVLIEQVGFHVIKRQPEVVHRKPTCKGFPLSPLQLFHRLRARLT